METATIDQAVVDQKLSESAATAVKQWLTEPEYADFKEEIQQLIAAGNWTKLEDNFFKNISFGTGGMRGHVGVGPNRINKRTIGGATQGYVTYLKSQLPDVAELKIVVAFDVRLTRDELSKHTASVLAGNGCHVYLFDDYRATPELSFAIRHLGANGGIVISASHNPSTDNGFKAYWIDGAQIVPPHDERIMAEVAKVKEILLTPYDEALKAGKIEIIGDAVDGAYQNAVLAESLSPNRGAKIVYSPIHGCGQKSLLPVLKKAGFDVTVIEEQMSPDGSFPNVANNIPNPEMPAANELTGKKVIETKADIGFTTDPDADRIAAMIPTDDEIGYKVIGGNTLAALTVYYVLSTLKEQGKLPASGFVVRTMVTTALIDAIAADFGVKVYSDLLVGIKYITQMISEHQDKEGGVFLVGGEESYGMLKGSYTREKDSAVTGLMLAEYASILKEQRKTLLDALAELYLKYGYFAESQVRNPFDGAAGFAAMNKMMAAFRDIPPAELGGMKVLKTTNRVQAADGSFVVRLFLSEDEFNVVTVRPSGTEPIAKFYVALCDERGKGASAGELESIKADVAARAEAITADLKAFAANVAK